MIQAIIKNRNLIMFLISLIVMILLAIWISDTLIKHIDSRVPEL